MSESDLQLSHLLHILFKNFVLSDEDFIFKLIIMFYFSLELFQFSLKNKRINLNKSNINLNRKMAYLFKKINYIIEFKFYC